VLSPAPSPNRHCLAAGAFFCFFCKKTQKKAKKPLEKSKALSQPGLVGWAREGVEKGGRSIAAKNICVAGSPVPAIDTERPETETRISGQSFRAPGAGIEYPTGSVLFVPHLKINDLVFV
jgi:hypothetical protein